MLLVSPVAIIATYKLCLSLKLFAHVRCYCQCWALMLT